MSVAQTGRDRILALAVAAHVNPKSAAKFVRGEPVRGDAGQRLALAAEALGIVIAPQSAEQHS